MALALTIAGVPQYFKNEEEATLTLSKVLNGLHTFSFKVLSDGSYRPVRNAEVIFTEDGTRRFGGLITYIHESSTAEERLRPELTFDITASSYNSYAARRIINETFAAGTTLEDILTALVATYYNTEYGVTLSGSQVTGPSMPALEFVDQKGDEVLTFLSDLTAEVGETYVWTIDEFKALSMYQPSTNPAPFNITSDTDADLYSDLEIETVHEENYANRVYVRVPTVTENDRQESFTGDGVADSFAIQYTVLSHYGHVLLSTGGGELLMTAPADPGIAWEYDPVTKILTRLAGAMTNGTIYTFQFNGEFSGTGMADDAGEIATWGLTEVVVTTDRVPEDATAQSLAEAELSKRLSSSVTASYSTLSFLDPGQSQTITSTYRNVNAVFTVMEVVSTDLGNATLKRRVTAVASTKRASSDNWRETYKQWFKDTTGAGGASITGSGGTASAAPPLNAVQTNVSGSFGGHVAFTFDQATLSLVMGNDSSIDIANAQSCAAIGDDCHIG